MSSFDVRLRLYSDDGVRGRVLPTLSLTATSPESATPTLTFAVSEKVAGRLEAPFLVGVEYSTGGVWSRPRNDLFIVPEEDGDSVDPSGTVTFTAAGVIPWQAARMPLWWRPGDFELYRRFDDRTPGSVLRELILLEQDPGVVAVNRVPWSPNTVMGFSDTTDSAGNAWSGRVTLAWPLFTSSLSTVMDQLSSQGYLEWWTEGYTLHAVNPGTGRDMSGAVVLGGPGFSRAPAQVEFDPATAVVVQYDGGWTHFVNPGADTRFGGLTKVMSQTGVATRPEAEKNVQPVLTASRAMVRELSYEWTPAGGTPVPWADFRVGDQVTARTRTGKLVQRVVGLVVSKRDGTVTARAIVGSKMLTLEAKLAKRSAAASVGQVIGGSGAAAPPVQQPGTAPLPPAALRVASNTASWADDGAEVSTVRIEWDAVTQAVDGSGIDPDLYEVWARPASGVSALLTATAGLAVTRTDLPPGQVRLVKVRARSRQGVWSAFSSEISVTPARAVSTVPKAPTGLTVVSNTGVFASDGSAAATVTVSWAAVTQSTDNTALTVAAYRAELEDGQAWVPVAETLTPREVVFTIPAGKVRRVRVLARTAMGVWGDPSTPLEVTGAQPAAITAPPTVPTLTTGGGGVFIRWDGLLTIGNPPAGFQGVYGEYRLGTTGGFQRVAGPLADAAGQVGQVRAGIGVVVQARLVLLDTLGRPGVTSAVASITTVGVTGPDVEVNSLTGNHIKAGSLSVDLVTPAFGASLNLAGNESINLIIDAQDATAAELDIIQSVFTVDAAGAHFGRTDMPFQTHMLADQFQITENGVSVASFGSGGMQSPRVQTDAIVLENHKIESFGTGTVVRYVS